MQGDLVADQRQEVALHQGEVAKILAVRPSGQADERHRQLGEDHPERLVVVDRPTDLARNLVEVLPTAMVLQSQVEEPSLAADPNRQVSAAEASGGDLLAEAGSKALLGDFFHYYPRACPSSCYGPIPCAGETPTDPCEVHPCSGASRSLHRAPL